MSKEELIEVFEDTQKLYNSENISKIIESSLFATHIYTGTIKINSNYQYEEPAVVKVTNRDTLTAAEEYACMGDICDENGFTGILNFASSTTPGGGVTKGSTAQEECICRCTTLYPALNQKICWDQYYNINRKANTNLGSDTIIHTQDILVLKDKNYHKLRKDQMFYVDVITCAAPNLREKPSNLYNDGASKTPLTLIDEELYNIHVQRAKRIFDVARAHDIDYLVLGAFGCGAFKNNPEIVARAYKDVIPEYLHYFKVIDFAIIDGKNSNNYEVFQKILLQ